MLAKLFAYGFLTLAVAGSTVAAPINTTGAVFGGLGGFGEPGSATYGQTFTATVGSTQLNSFSFRFNDHTNPDAVDFAAHVYAWNGKRATGPQLFGSAQMTSTNNGGAGGLEVFTVNTGGIQLTAGQKYVALFTALFDGIPGSSQQELSISDVYAGGQFVFFNNTGDNAGLLTSSDWVCRDGCLGGRDLWFLADLTDGNQLPEAASWILSLAALGAMGVVRRRRTAVSTSIETSGR